MDHVIGSLSCVDSRSCARSSPEIWFSEILPSSSITDILRSQIPENKKIISFQLIKVVHMCTIQKIQQHVFATIVVRKVTFP